MKTFLVILISLCVIKGWAQAELPDAPSSSFLQVDHPQSEGRHGGKVRWMAMAFQAGGLIIDGMTTAQIPGQHWHGDPLSPCYEAWSPRLYGREPSAPRVAFVMSLEFLSTQGIAWAARRGVFGPWLADHDYLIMIGNGSGHWFGGVHNLVGGCQ